MTGLVLPDGFSRQLSLPLRKVNLRGQCLNRVVIAAERRKFELVIELDVLGRGESIFQPQSVTIVACWIVQNRLFLFHGKEKRMRATLWGWNAD